MRIELRNAGKVIEEPKKELRLVGQALERYRDTAHRSLDVPCPNWSHWRRYNRTRRLQRMYTEEALHRLVTGDELPSQPGVQCLDAPGVPKIAWRSATSSVKNPLCS